MAINTVVSCKNVGLSSCHCFEFARPKHLSAEIFFFLSLSLRLFLFCAGCVSAAVGFSLIREIHCLESAPSVSSCAESYPAYLAAAAEERERERE